MSTRKHNACFHELVLPSEVMWGKLSGVKLQANARGCCQPINNLHCCMDICVCVCLWLQVVCRFLCEEATGSLTEKQFIPAVRKFIIRHLLSGFFSKSFKYINMPGCACLHQFSTKSTNGMFCVFQVVWDTPRCCRLTSRRMFWQLCSDSEPWGKSKGLFDAIVFKSQLGFSGQLWSKSSSWN